MWITKRTYCVSCWLTKKICNPWCHQAIHHQLNYCEPKGLNFKIPYKNYQHWWFSTPPLRFQKQYLGGKANSKVELNIQVFLKNLSKLKTRFRHFQFFPLVLNHITHEHTCAQRVHTQMHRHARALALTHKTQTKEKQCVTSLRVVYREIRQLEKQCPLDRHESAPETLKGTKRLSQNRGIP